MFVIGPVASSNMAMTNTLPSHGIRIRSFPVAKEYPESLGEGDCDLLVIDLDGDTLSDMSLLDELERTCPDIPKLVLVDYGDISTAVQAIKAGANDCLEKPVEPEQLGTRIDDLLRQADQNTRALKPNLTPTEIMVLSLLLEGKTNTEAARVLHRSPRTIEVHRAHIMRKLAVSNMVDLVKTAITLGLSSGG